MERGRWDQRETTDLWRSPPLPPASHVGWPGREASIANRHLGWKAMTTSAASRERLSWLTRSWRNGGDVPPPLRHLCVSRALRPVRAAVAAVAAEEAVPGRPCRHSPPCRPGRSSSPAAAVAAAAVAGMGPTHRSPTHPGMCGLEVSWRRPIRRPEARVGSVSSCSLSLVISPRQRNWALAVPSAEKAKGNGGRPVLPQVGRRFARAAGCRRGR